MPAAGMTIMEHFERLADNVSFAVVLLTSDEPGGPISQRDKQQLPRARQNVIFELGYFLGKLGRSRVCALYDSDIELPSDIYGLVAIPRDATGSWRLALARQLKTAGIDVEIT
jgi:predicted nucleotide-binding protein